MTETVTLDYSNILILAAMILCCIIRHFLLALPELIYWWTKDIIHFDRELFRPFGCWFYVGKQGSGKSMSLIWRLEKLRKRYPKAKIYTNMCYKFETAPLKGLKDLLNEDNYNGKYGTIFVIDEIQNEFSCKDSKDFPESVLSLITQQRKNRILILCTSQVFTRVAKPLREQCYRVVECQTFFGRYTRNKIFNGISYADSIDLPPDQRRKSVKKIGFDAFCQTDYLRTCFDSYKLIKRLNRVGFAPKVQSNNTVTHLTVNNKTFRR